MIATTPQMRIWVVVEPIDFRVGIDGLVAACRQRLKVDPYGGALFVFRNKARTSIRVLAYDGQGFWCCNKRLSSGRFNFWPTGDTPGITLQAWQLQMLVMGGDPARAIAAPLWRPLPMVS